MERDGAEVAREGYAAAVTCAIVALTAIAGGAALLLSPDGSVFGLPPSTLRFSPFHDFTIPGLVLMIAVVGSNAVAAISGWRDPGAMSISIAGVTLLGWIVGEMLLLRTAEALQLVYLVIAAAILVLWIRARI